MLTDKYIKSYAVIKSRWISENLLDAYLPFIVTIIKENSMGDIDESVLYQEIKKKYNISLHPTMIRQVLSHAMSKNIIKKVRERYISNTSQLEQFVIPESDFNKLWEALISDFIPFSSALNLSFSRDETEENIVKFIDAYDDHIIYNGIGDIDMENNRFVYAWCKYIIYVKELDVEKYEFILALCTANLIKNTLFYTSNEQATQSSLKVYIDTPMIFALLGMDTPERQKSYSYILEKVTQAGMKLYIFDHNFEEATGIMERASRWAVSSQYDSAKANKVAEFFHDSGMDENEISDFIAEVETTLNSLGITQDFSTYLADEDKFQADEEHLQTLIKAEYGKRSIKYTTEELYDNSIRTDVRSLVMVDRKRSGGYSSDLNNSRYLFITTNKVVAKVSKDYAAAGELSRDKIPSCITADIFGTLLWMEFPEQRENYLSLKMLADCRALLRPTTQMIAQFNLQLDEAYKRRDEGLTEQRFLFLRSHPIVRNKLLDVTSGDYSQFTDHTWRDVYDAIESNARYEGEQKYQVERSEHEKTKFELGTARQTIIDKESELDDARHTIVHRDEELKQANQVITDKDAKINEQKAKLRNQADNFSLIIARIITIAIFGLPYIAMCVILATVQNDWLDWTVRGISIGAITVIMSIISGCLYKKIEKSIQKKIRAKID